MEIIADLHIHSKYSRACSKDMVPKNIGLWADKKGINIIGTGDFTHPLWLSELKEALEEDESGLFRLKNRSVKARFMLTTELSCIYTRGNKIRRVHHLVLAPSFKAVEKLIKSLLLRGCNLASDGRPILGLDSRELTKIILDASEDCLVVPAHCWTPWFSVFGSESGFDSLEECLGEMTKYIHAIETGLSSDPAMNWRWSSLDNLFLISNSDAHSLSNLGREANVFKIDESSLCYYEIIRILRERDRTKFLYTIEFYPEEGKYHYDGHRLCRQRLHPRETIKFNGLCPSCKKSVTVGVLHRVDKLSDRQEGYVPESAIPFKKIVPLEEVIAESLGVKSKTLRVKRLYDQLTSELSEFDVLLRLPLNKFSKIVTPEMIEAIKRVREGKLYIEPGYDGTYGIIKIFSSEERKSLKQASLL